MANVVNTQVIHDGPRNAVIKVDLALDTADLAAQTIFDPAVQAKDTIATTGFCAIQRVDYFFQGSLVGQLLWDATADKSVLYMGGTGFFDARDHGVQNFPNNAGAGKTGVLQLSTSGWATGTLRATLVISLVKTNA